VVPPQAAGTVDVQVTNYAGTSATGSADHFTYSNASAPTVTALSTNGGPLAGGTIVTITGTNFHRRHGCVVRFERRDVVHGLFR